MPRLEGRASDATLRLGLVADFPPVLKMLLGRDPDCSSHHGVTLVLLWWS